MTRGRCEGNRFVAENIDYYRQRASSGVGLIISEGMVVDHPLASGPGGELPRLLPAGLDSMRALTAAVHAADGRIAAQLWHQGHQIPDGGISASEVCKDGRVVGREATPADLAAIIDAFGRAAALAKAAGFDAVELHGAHGYLLDSFLRRWGTWRGEPCPASTLVGDVVREVRRRVGPGYPIIFRLSQWSIDSFAESYMHDLGDIAQVVQPLAGAGVDILHVSTRRFWEPAFPGGGQTLAALVRSCSGLPVIAVGGMGKNIADGPDRHATYAHADRLLAAGAFDLLAVGTGLLRDSGWCDKARRQAFSEMEIVDPKKS